MPEEKMFRETPATARQEVTGSQYPVDNQFPGATVTNDRYPEFTPEPIDKRPLIIGFAFAGLIVLVSVGLGVWFFFHPVEAEVIRDIMIIFIGLSLFFILIFLIVLIIMISYLVLKTNDLMRLLDREVRPLLYNIQQTTGTVRGTTTFLSDQAVKPVIAVASSYAAVRATVRSLFRR